MAWKAILLIDKIIVMLVLIKIKDFSNVLVIQVSLEPNSLKEVFHRKSFPYNGLSDLSDKDSGL